MDRPLAAKIGRTPGESDGRRILIVDDNHDAAEAIAELLRAVGHTVETAPDGSRALSMASALRPDVCLVDIGLPLMDGYEVARLLRTTPGVRPEVRLIALTGYGQEDDRRRSADAGFDLHLVKPVTLDVLDEAVRAAR